MRDARFCHKYALGSTSNRVYSWRLVLEEYGPENIYIKRNHNTVEDAISKLDFSPKAHPESKPDTPNRMILAKCWCALENHTENSNNNHNIKIEHVFANCSDEEEIYPLTVSEIEEEQIHDELLQKQKKSCNYKETLIEDKLVIPKTVQQK